MSPLLSTVFLREWAKSAALCASLISRFARYGFFPYRNGCKLQSSNAQAETSLLLPQQQSRHFSRIAFTGFVCMAFISFFCATIGDFPHFSGGGPITAPRIFSMVSPPVFSPSGCRRSCGGAGGPLHGQGLAERAQGPQPGPPGNTDNLGRIFNNAKVGGIMTPSPHTGQS